MSDAVSLAGRGAVVTGAGRGIGSAVARALAQAGAAVILAARTALEIERAAGELCARGARAWAVPCDVAEPDSVRRLGAAARAQLDSVDILVNNAGVAGSAPFARIALEDWERMLAVIATGTFLCTREFLPDMLGRGWGRVVNVASVAGLQGGKYVAHYSAAKHAVMGLTRSVALEVAGRGVTVNAVCPAYVDTPMTEQTLASVQARTGLSQQGALEAVLESVGQARLITPAEVAAAVLDLCSAAASDVNGEAIVLRGSSSR